MKLKFCVLFLAIGAIADVSATSLDPKTTPHSYDRNRFCENGAQNKIKELNDLTKSDIAKAKKIQIEINELKGRKNLVEGFLQMRNEFETSLHSMAEKYSENESARLDNFKQLLRSSLALNAVSLLAKNNSNDKNNIKELCEDQENANTKFCHSINKWWKNSITSNEVSTLNDTIANYKMAMGNLSVDEKDKVKRDLEGIYQSIPASIAPEEILDVLMTKSEKLSTLLSSSANKETILACLKENGDACKHLVSDSKKQQDLKKILSSELLTVHQEFNERKLSSFFNSFDQSPKKTEGIDKLMNDQFGEAMSFFDKENKNAKISDLKKYCSDSQVESLRKCSEFASHFIAFFNNENANIDKDIITKTNDLDKIINDGHSFAMLEKMKQYVAQKYLRTCNNASEKDITSNITCANLVENEMGRNLQGEDSEIGLISSKLSNIVGKLRESNPTLSANSGELGPFSKDELKVYSDYCNNSSNRAKFNDICKDIFEEKNAISNQHESKDWDEFNRKYWVSYDPSSPKGYSVKEKKSNLRILGEGVLQGVGQVVPLWFTNFQLNNQIEMLTNQALYQKQMNYMYSPNSPWMNVPYFQGSYFMTSGFNATSYSTPVGYNFSN